MIGVSQSCGPNQAGKPGNHDSGGAQAEIRSARQCPSAPALPLPRAEQRALLTSQLLSPRSLPKMLVQRNGPVGVVSATKF